CRAPARPDRRSRRRRVDAERSENRMKGYLLVRSEGKTYGLPVARVLEVGDATEVLPIPHKLPAIRGLTPLRGRLVPLIHLAAFLTGSDTPPAVPGVPSGVRTVV